MQDSVILVRERWHALCREILLPGGAMKMLVLAALKDDELEAIGRGCVDPMDRVFREALSITVAQVRDDIQTDIMKHADNPYAYFERKSDRLAITSLDEAEDKYKEMFRQDMERVHAALFNIGFVYAAEAEMRIMKKSKVPVLHQDSAGDDYPGVFAASYFCRMGALAARCMSGKDQLNASDQVQQWIDVAMDPLAPAKVRAEAMERLCENKILVSSELGEVKLLLARNHDEMGNVGTLHVSPPMPPDEPFSAFLHVRGLIS